jgi:hypothetical protein
VRVARRFPRLDGPRTEQSGTPSKSRACGSRLHIAGRFASGGLMYRVESMPSRDPSPPGRWNACGHRNQDLARLFGATFRQRRQLAEHYAWVPAPPSSVGSPYCRSVAPYPAGALVRLWNGWDYLRGRCPDCRGPALGFALAGGLAGGHVLGVCLQCASMLTQFIPGIHAIMAGIRPILAGTPFSVTGGSVPMRDRAPTALIAVLQELGESNLPSPSSPGLLLRSPQP